MSAPLPMTCTAPPLLLFIFNLWAVESPQIRSWPLAPLGAVVSVKLRFEAIAPPAKFDVPSAMLIVYVPAATLVVSTCPITCPLVGRVAPASWHFPAVELL